MQRKLNECWRNSRQALARTQAMQVPREDYAHVPHGGGPASPAANDKGHTHMDERSVRDMEEALCANEK